jgi:hypothetical protein
LGGREKREAKLFDGLVFGFDIGGALDHQLLGGLHSGKREVRRNNAELRTLLMGKKRRETERQKRRESEGQPDLLFLFVLIDHAL